MVDSLTLAGASVVFGVFVILAAPVTLPGASAVSALTYSDATSATNNVLSLLPLPTGVVTETTAKTSYSALQTDLGATLGASSYAAISSAVSGAPLSITATGAGGFVLDNAVSTSFFNLQTTSANAPITIAAPITETLATGLVLQATGTLTINGQIALSGGGAVNLTYGAGGGVAFGQGAYLDYGPVNAGGILTINGQVYALLYSLSDFAGINGSSGYDALAHSFNASSTPYSSSVDAMFSGTLEGLGNTITGLTINASGNDVGLIGTLDPGGIIKDINLAGAAVTGGSYTGALVGVNAGTITNASTAGSVHGQDEVGGLVGKNTGQLSDVSAAGAVHGHYRTGGLVGQNAQAITNASSAVAVTGGDSLAGSSAITPPRRNLWRRRHLWDRHGDGRPLIWRQHRQWIRQRRGDRRLWNRRLSGPEYRHDHQR